MQLKAKGQTLVEISIVFGISSIVIVSLVILASSALRQAQESVRRVSASKLANAGIESVIFYKNINGFGVFPFNMAANVESCVKMSLINNASTLSSLSCSTPGDTVFTPDGLSYIREIHIRRGTAANPNTYTINVIVSWQAGGSGEIDRIQMSRIVTNYDY